MKITEALLRTACETARKFGATRLILFGSALDPSREVHDLDLACAGVPGWKLFEPGAAVEDELRIPIALVPLDSPSRFHSLIEARGKRLR